jgi:thiamine pyrophosphokinase
MTARRCDTVVVFAGGPAPLARWRAAVPSGAPVIAADRGVRHALAFGLRVEVAVGDFDSISAAELATVERSGGRLERHPEDKDASDLELALDCAVRFGPRRILVLGGRGGRLDHLLGELVLLARDAYAAVEIDALLGGARLHVVRGERLLSGRIGETISLFATGRPVVGVVSEGLRFPLQGDTLEPGSSRGISNVFTARQVRLVVQGGALLAIRPGSSV